MLMIFEKTYRTDEIRKNNMKKICIWGTGNTGKKVYYLLKDLYEIECFYDNDSSVCELYGIPVKKYNGEKSYIVIASVLYWKDIMRQLIGYGLKPINDIILPELMFTDNSYVEYRLLYEIATICKGKIDYKLLFKNTKVISLYGNCQTELIAKSLSMTSSIAKSYVVVLLPCVFEYNISEWHRNCIINMVNDTDFFESIDLFLYQKVSLDNKFSPIISTDYILPQLRSECKKIELINIYFDGYFPQEILSCQRFGTELHQSGFFPFDDKYIINLLKENKTEDEIIRIITTDDFIDKESVYNRVKESFDEIKRREEEVDITISDYIEQYYTEEQLFYSRNHPNEKVILEYTNRIVEYLGYEREDYSHTDFFLKCSTLKGQDVPIYPSVIKILGLKKFESKYYPNRYIFPDRLYDFEEFQRKYICYKAQVAFL